MWEYLSIIRVLKTNNTTDNTVFHEAALGHVVLLNRLHHYVLFSCEKIKTDLQSIDIAQGLLPEKI